MKKFFIAPSILSANFLKLGNEIELVNSSGADFIHIDVMDNHYVPNLTFGPLICESISRITNLPIDVHLMVKPVDDLAIKFAKAGAKIISFHPEASKHVDRTIRLIKGLGCKVGLVLNPATPINCLDWTITDIDLVLIMSVNPGFGGQKFLSKSIQKIISVKKMIDLQKKEIFLAVDGGINSENITEIYNAGANFFVMGTSIFKTHSYRETIAEMRRNIKNDK